jgi:hypothetical protein
MSAPRELNHPDDFVILTVDVADSPIAELRLSEIYDVKTSTMNDDYLLVFKEYVALQLKATFGLCDRYKLRLLDSHVIPLHCRANGDVVSLRKPAMERLIRQTLQSRLDICSPVSASILIQFKTPGLRIPRRLHDSPCIPPKIGGVARHNKDVITAIPTGVRADSQHAYSLQFQHLAGHTPTVGGISFTDSTTVDSFVTFEPGTCVSVHTFPPVYPFNVSDCPTASDSDAPHDSACRDAMQIIPEGAATAYEVEEEGSSAVGSICLQAVLKDTDGRASRMVFIASKISDFGPFDSSNNEGQNRNILCNADSADGYIVIMDENGDHNRNRCRH